VLNYPLLLLFVLFTLVANNKLIKNKSQKVLL